MPKRGEETAYVLDEGRFHSPSVGPHVFSDFPGRWSPGEPIAVRDLGLNEEEAASRIAELGLPLKKTSARSQLAGQERPAGEMQPIASGAELPSRPEALLERDSSSVPGLGAEEARERASYDAEHPISQAQANVVPSQSGPSEPEPNPEVESESEKSADKSAGESA